MELLNQCLDEGEEDEAESGQDRGTLVDLTQFLGSCTQDVLTSWVVHTPKSCVHNLGGLLDPGLFRDVQIEAMARSPY